MISGCAEMREAERRAFEAGIAEESLMEQAGEGVAEAVMQFHPAPGRAAVFFGRGHNGGDALVAARRLRERGWSVELFAAASPNRLAPLTAKKLAEFYSLAGGTGGGGGPFDAILDGILGTGSRGEPAGAVAEGIDRINDLRESCAARTYAIDLPSGMNGDTGAVFRAAVRADCTVAVGAVKRGLLADAATDRVGRLALVPLERVSFPAGEEEVAFPGALRGLLPRRRFDTHKGDYGRVTILAGSAGFAGAALLAAAGALRAGAGLVTLCAPGEIFPQLAAAAGASMPELMVRPVERFAEAAGPARDALVIGPGLGAARAGEILELLAAETGPALVDADALNAVAAGGPGAIEHPAGPRLLTPHPGEMGRLFPDPEPGQGRAAWAGRFAARYPVTLLLKGARSLVAERGKPLCHNPTGSPGMASGGMGDLLSGICGALLARGLVPRDAAKLGIWTLGRAAEIALSAGTGSEESLLPTDVAARIGAAFLDLRRGCY